LFFEITVYEFEPQPAGISANQKLSAGLLDVGQLEKSQYLINMFMDMFSGQ